MPYFLCDLIDHDALRPRAHRLGQVNLAALRRGLGFAAAAGAVVFTLAYAGQERGRLAASARPALLAIDEGPDRSPLAEMVGADRRLFAARATATR